MKQTPTLLLFPPVVMIKTNGVKGNVLEETLLKLSTRKKVLASIFV